VCFNEVYHTKSSSSSSLSATRPSPIVQNSDHPTEKLQQNDVARCKHPFEKQNDRQPVPEAYEKRQKDL
jgi:hypothetical protein